MKLLRCVIPFACVATAFACHKNERAGETTTSAGSPDGNAAANRAASTGNAGSGENPSTTPMRYETATARITGARCDREITCNQVGSNKRFETRAVCTMDQGKKTQDELKSADCPNGIDTAKLETCLSWISQRDCSQLLSSNESLDACKKSVLCR